MNDVTDPSYYAARGLCCPACHQAVETVEVIEGWDLNWCLGHVIKYVSRAGFKPASPRLADLEKARWFLTREIEKARRDEAPSGKG